MVVNPSLSREDYVGHSALLHIWMDQETRIADEISTRLNNSGVSVAISSLSEITELHHIQNFDVFITENTDVIETLREYISPTSLLILLSTQMNQSTDLVLECNPVVVHRQLVAMAKIRAQSIEREHGLFVQLTATKTALDAQVRSGQRLEVMKEALIYNVQHEMRTPLLQMKAAVNFLAEGIYKHNDTDVVALAALATARLESFVNNISHLTSSIKDMEIGTVQVQDSIHAAIHKITRSWQHKNEKTRIHLHLDDNLPLVLGNKLALSTVIELLLDNGLKFSKDQQMPVDVFAERKGRHVVITVADQGIGIERKEFEYIFDSFYQVDSSSTRAYGGAGLGLAIVRMIMDHHGTKIKVESRVGKYTRFSFKLPITKL